MDAAQLQRKKVNTASLSVISNTFLILIKLAAGLLSGSVSIISEAIHSSMDLLAAIIAFFSVKVSNNPPDEKHPYGHGKFENVSGVIEAVLIFIAAGWIIYEAVHKLVLLNNGEALEIGYLEVGFAVMFTSALVNTIVARKLYKTAKLTDSVALEADALHLKTDVYTSIGVGVGLVLIMITGYQILDPIIAIIVALFIIFESFVLLKKAYSPLLDTTLPEDDLAVIHNTLSKFVKEDTNYHQLRTRKSGNFKYVDMHLELPEQVTVKESHDLCDDIETALKSKIKHLEVTIHIEPRENRQQS
jgi:cation diffusion facilitator family transporter